LLRATQDSTGCLDQKDCSQIDVTVSERPLKVISHVMLLKYALVREEHINEKKKTLSAPAYITLQRTIVVLIVEGACSSILPSRIDDSPVVYAIRACNVSKP